MTGKLFAIEAMTIPIGSMYGIFTYIWPFMGQMMVNIPYMEHMG